MKARDGSRSRHVDRIVTRSALVREFLAEYDADPANAPVLRELVIASGGSGGAFDLSQLPRASTELRAALARTASALGLDRLSPGSGFEDSWHDTRGALPDGQTVLLRWLSWASLAQPLPALSGAVLSPPKIVHGEFTFKAEWDPTRESEQAAKARLLQELKQQLDAEFSAARRDGEQAEYEATPELLERPRDMRWLYWHVRYRLDWDAIVNRSREEGLRDLRGSPDPEAVVQRATARMGRRVGVKTRRSI